MDIKGYLEDQACDGLYQGEGSFQIDLTKAAHKLAASALPSEHHYLLKVVQVANILSAERMEIKIRRRDTTVRFRAAEPGSLAVAGDLAKSLNEPLAAKEPALAALTSAILGTLNQSHSGTSWQMSGGGKTLRTSIDAKHRVSIEEEEAAAEDDDWSFELQVWHRGSWKFWLGAAGRAESVSLLRHHCRFSATRIIIDGAELTSHQASVLNEHIVDLESLRGVSTSRKRAQVPATMVSFRLAEQTENAVSLLRPSLSAYVVRKDNLNLWASSTRANNSLRPDGESSVAWMLQFRRKNRDLSIRLSRKRDLYTAVLSVNLTGSAKDTTFKVFMVQHGVLLVEQDILSVDKEMEKFRGCTLLFADDRLETDLSGLQLLDTKQLRQAVFERSHLVEEAHEYVERALPLVTGLEL